MKQRNLPGLSPLWLMLLAMTLGIFLLVAVPVLISANAISSTAWIGFAGSIFTGLVALIAVLVATRNVRKQLRINLLVREEERIESQIPGLREIAGVLEELLPNLKPPEFKDVLAGLVPVRSVKHLEGLSDIQRQVTIENGQAYGSVTDESVSLVVPKADQVTRQQLLVILQSIEHAARTLYAYNREDIGKNVRLHVLMQEVYTLDEFSKKILRRIDLYEERLPKFRDEIEEYFNE